MNFEPMNCGHRQTPARPLASRAIIAQRRSQPRFRLAPKPEPASGLHIGRLAARFCSAILRGESPLLPGLTRYISRLGIRVAIIDNDPSGVDGRETDCAPA
jgi:hypothetical protein